MITDGAGCPAGYYLKLDTQVCTLLSSWSDSDAMTANTQRVADSLGLGGELEVCKEGFFYGYDGSSAYACLNRSADVTAPAKDFGYLINKVLIIKDNGGATPTAIDVGTMSFSGDIVCLQAGYALDS